MIRNDKNIIKTIEIELIKVKDKWKYKLIDDGEEYVPTGKIGLRIKVNNLISKLPMLGDLEDKKNK